MALDTITDRPPGMIRRCRSVLATVVAASAIGAALAAHSEEDDGLRMLMFTQPGCSWCAAWDREIGPIWPNSPEGRTAAMTTIDRRADLPQGVTLDRPVTLTPTFVLLEGGTEIARLEGYPGADFFWFHIGRMIEAAEASDPGGEG